MQRRIRLSLITCLMYALYALGAETIISGTVLDTNGLPLGNAIALLSASNLRDTTDEQGRFSFALSSPTVRPSIQRGAQPISWVIKGSTFLIRGEVFGKGRLAVYLTNGRLVYQTEFRKTAFEHSLSLPDFKENMVVICLALPQNNMTFVAQSLARQTNFAASILEKHTPEAGTASLGKVHVYHEILEIVKQGFLDYRISSPFSDSGNLEIRMIANAGNLVDIKGNVYQCVKIGDQIWTAQNVRTSALNDGNELTNIPQWDYDTSAAYCAYRNTENEDSMRLYGHFYNGFTMESGNLAPDGWRIPTMSDWDTLFSYVTAHIAGKYAYDSTAEISPTKALCSKVGWSSSTVVGSPGHESFSNNTTGLSLTAAGSYSASGDYNLGGEAGTWWCADRFSFTIMSSEPSHLVGNPEFLSFDPRFLGYSVRFVRDR